VIFNKYFCLILDLTGKGFTVLEVNITFAVAVCRIHFPDEDNLIFARFFMIISMHNLGLCISYLFSSLLFHQYGKLHASFYFNVKLNLQFWNDPQIIQIFYSLEDISEFSCEVFLHQREMEVYSLIRFALAFK
jgi:hypothetical protein